MKIGGLYRMSIKEEYRKQRRRIQSFLRKAEKRGYRFNSGVLPKIPNRITRASVRRLAKLTPEELYKKATALSESGKVITGTQRRKEEKKIAAQKAAGTKRRRKSYFGGGHIPTVAIIYDNIMRMINEYAVFHPQTASALIKILENQIILHGFDSVMERLENQAEEAIEKAQKALEYKEGSENSIRKIYEFAQLLNGAPLSVSESKEFEKTMNDFF